MKTLVPQLILDQFSRGNYRGEFQAATASVDISGFTPLTETLFQQQQDGAEILGETLSAIFGPLVSAVYRAGGLIPLYAGDSFTAIFPDDSDQTPQYDQNALHRAWKTAQVVQQHLMPAGKPRSFQTTYGNFSISVKIGIGTGHVQWGIVGENGLQTYYFRGSAITTATMAQQKAAPGRIAFNDHINNLSTFPTISQLPLTAASPLPPDQQATHLSRFISQDILTLPIQAEFRHACPVFISVRLPIETNILEKFIVDVLHLTHHYGGFFSQVEFGEKGMVLLLYFGAPISYENNVLRAARCLSNLSEPRPQSKHLHPIWRAGLTYGLVWAGFRGGPERQEYGIIGDVVNSAARIAQEANWGEIWLDKQAAEQISDEFECHYIGKRYLKGKQIGKILYRLAGFRTKINITYQGQMIGRQKELDTLKKAVAPIFHGDFAGVSFIYGEAGMGKSRLVYELQQEITEHNNWLYCPADEVLRQSLNPFRYYFQNFFLPIIDGSTDATRRARFIQTIDQIIGRLPDLSDEKTAELTGELKRTQSCLAALINIYWPDSLYERLKPRLRYDNTVIAITTFIQIQALIQPLIIHVEDFHWFDLDSCYVLEKLSQKLTGYPVALIITSRFATDGSQPTFQIPKTVSQTIIQLETLDRTGVRALAEQLLGNPIHSDLLGFLEEKSGGRPFFAEQLLLELSDQNAIEFVDGQYHLLPEKAGTIPTTLNTLLISRLDNLSLPIKQVVQTAAILGERFLVPVLSAILAQDKLPDMLEMAVQQQIWVLQDELRYIFKHALLRDAAYVMQPQSHRRELHRLAAEKLEQLYTGQLTSFYGEIAYHYEKAYLQGVADVRDSAVHFLTRAAERAAENYENDTAVDYINRALAILPETAYENKYDLLLLREKIHSLQAGLEQWGADLAALSRLVGWSMGNTISFEEAPPLADPARQAKIALLSVRYTYQKGNYSLAENFAKQGKALFGEVGDQFGEAWCLALQGGMLWELGQFDKVVECLTLAIEIFRKLGKNSMITGCINTLGITAADQGNYMEAWDYYEEALKLIENRDISDKVMTLSNLGEAICWLGLYDKSQEYIERGLRLARQIGHRQRQSLLLLNLSIVTLERQDWQLGQHYLNRCLDICREITNRREEGTAMHFLGNAAVLEGDLTTAESYFNQALEIREQLGQKQFAAEDRAGLAWIAHQQGHPEQARRYLSAVVDYLGENPAMFGAYKPLNVYWRIYQVARDIDQHFARELLITAQNIIQTRAAKIPDPDIRRAYLTNVSENHALLNEK